MIAYASQTGTRRNVALLRQHGWRVLLSPAHIRDTGDFRYALDNGAWGAYAQAKPWDERAFGVALKKVGGGADFTVLPDIVTGGRASLDLSLRWMRRVLDETPRVLLAVQNGMEPSDVRPWIGDRVGIFVGGDTRWKLLTLFSWAALARDAGCWFHVGRVNSTRRISLCANAGATSFDGTSASRYAVTIRPLDSARRQLALEGASTW